MLKHVINYIKAPNIMFLLMLLGSGLSVLIVSNINVFKPQTDIVIFFELAAIGFFLCAQFTSIDFCIKYTKHPILYTSFIFMYYIVLALCIVPLTISNIIIVTFPFTLVLVIVLTFLLSVNLNNLVLFSKNLIKTGIHLLKKSSF